MLFDVHLTVSNAVRVSFNVQSSISSSNDPENPTFITPDSEPEPVTKLADSDPPKYEDEWGNGSTGVDVSAGEDENLLELKRCLVDTVYGTDFGFRASSEIRVEALEFVSQLEAANPTPAPNECPELLDGNWILVFTAFSELLPLLAVGNIPLLKVEKISQDINTSSLTIENSTTLSSPVATLSFSATATFEVRSPSRIQVEFKEGSFKPPDIKSNIDLPETVDVFGQKLSLSPSTAISRLSLKVYLMKLFFVPKLMIERNMSNKSPVKLDDEQLAELREIFRSFDRNDDGSLTQLELGALLRSLGLKPSADQLETLIQKADKNDNGLVEFSEFVSLVAPELLPAKSPYTEEQLKQLFKMFDRDGNGYITAAELAHSMAKLGHALSVEELTGMIREADTDGDGRISYQEFTQAITSAAFDNSWA
ncbi:hypothetical protein K7X08_012665 [Anisodus acutangulus]|uniref:EF-hand domain-containing protein n=2 Tax=Anisodus TaxID=243963 RepID=A0A9Q1RDS3_9SOLA|nr:hypothetical protein K7X08_012665 [Anisodus acutangulus]